MTTPALLSAVNRAYDVFGRLPAPHAPLNVCTSCCMSDALELQMRTWPLRKLTAHHFYEYCTGAMGDLVQPPAEVRYLLPRWLELLSNGEQTHHSIELALDRVGRCPPGAFAPQERQVLEEFALAYFDESLQDLGPCDHGSDPLSVVIMADVAGLDVGPLLNHWAGHPGPASILKFVRCTYWDFWPNYCIGNAFATDRLQLQAAFKDWILAPQTKSAFLAKLVDPQFLAHVEQSCCHYAVPNAVMVEAVFDHLST